MTSFSRMVSSLTIDVASFNSWLDLKPVDEHVSMHWFTLWFFLFETFLSFCLSVVCELCLKDKNFPVPAVTDHVSDASLGVAWGSGVWMIADTEEPASAEVQRASAAAAAPNPSRPDRISGRPTNKDKRAARVSAGNGGGIKILSDLNKSQDSDSNSNGPQEYYTGGEKRLGWRITRRSSQRWGSSG